MVDKKKILAKVINKFFDVVLDRYVEPETICELEKEHFERLEKAGCVIVCPVKPGSQSKKGANDSTDEVDEAGETEDESEESEESEDEETSDAPDDVDDLSAKSKKPKLGNKK